MVTGSWSRQVSESAGGFVEQSQGVWASEWAVLPTNFNGDGLTDFFLYNTQSGTWFKVQSTPTGFTYTQGVWRPGWERYVMDLNGDGLSDIFLYDPTTGDWFKCVSTPAGFTYAHGRWIPGWELYTARLNSDAHSNRCPGFPLGFPTGFQFSS